MFRNDYKKQTEELTAQVAHLAKQLEDIAKHSDKLHIIKFVYDNPDQFMLDGQYVMDDTKTVYGAHSVSFSEAVMFKAGKEAAKREFDIIQAQTDEVISRLKQELQKTRNELKEEKNYVQELLSRITESSQKSAKELQAIQTASSEAATVYENQLQQLRMQVSEKESTIQALCDELDSWKRGEAVDEPLPLLTSCGIVEDKR